MFGKRDRLKTLFKQRRAQWDRGTERLMKELGSNVLPAIAAFAAQTNNKVVAEHLKFTDADIVYTDEYPEGVVVVWGRTIYSEGEEVELPNGEHVVLTQQDTELLSSPIEVSLPYEMAVNGSVETIVNFLAETYEQMQERVQQLIQDQAEHLETPGDQMEEYLYNMLNNLNEEENEPPPSLDIDLSDYSDTEQQLIKMAHNKTGHIKH